MSLSSIIKELARDNPRIILTHHRAFFETWQSAAKDYERQNPIRSHSDFASALAHDSYLLGWYHTRGAFQEEKVREHYEIAKRSLE